MNGSLIAFRFARIWHRGMRKVYVKVRVGKRWYGWHFGWWHGPSGGLDRWDEA